jgi:hypothetical protein
VVKEGKATRVLVVEVVEVDVVDDVLDVDDVLVVDVVLVVSSRSRRHALTKSIPGLGPKPEKDRPTRTRCPA